MVLPPLVLLGVAACAGPDKSGPSGATQAFYSALAGDDGARACAELAPETLQKLEESEGKPCDEAVTSLGLTATPVQRVEVFGHGARVVLRSDTAFLGRFPDGWRITAAGCKEQGEERPYDCQVEG